MASFVDAGVLSDAVLFYPIIRYGVIAREGSLSRAQVRRL
jgi:hypothetical protein